MSVEVTSWVLSNSPTSGNAKVILLGLSNHAHPDGSECYPAVDTLAKYSRVDRRTVQRKLRELEAAGHIRRDGVGPHGQAKWQIVMEVSCVDSTEGGDILPLRQDAAGAAPVSPLGAAPVSPEPSIEPSIGDSARTRSVSYRGRRVPDETVQAAESLLARFAERSGRQIGGWRGDGRPSASLRQIIGALLDRPDVPVDAWRRGLDRTFDSPPGWVKGPVQLGHVFGERAADWALTASAPPGGRPGAAAGSSVARRGDEVLRDLLARKAA